MYFANDFRVNPTVYCSQDSGPQSSQSWDITIFPPITLNVIQTLQKLTYHQDLEVMGHSVGSFSWDWDQGHGVAGGFHSGWGYRGNRGRWK